MLLRVAGKDASTQFDQFHNNAILQQWGPKLYKGDVGSQSQQPAKEQAVEDQEPQGLAEGEPFGDGIPFGDPYWYSDWYSPYYNESHRRLRAHMRAFVEKEIIPYCHEWDEQKELPRSLFLKAAEAGVLQCCVGAFPTKYAQRPPPVGIKPEEFDGFHEFIICDELSRCGAGGVLWGLIGGLGIGLPPVLHFGSDYLKDKVVAECIEGRKNICLAITEPSAGSDVANLKCEAKKTADGKFFILNGEKKWITNGTFADYFTVAWYLYLTQSHGWCRNERPLSAIGRARHAWCQDSTHAMHGRMGQWNHIHNVRGRQSASREHHRQGKQGLQGNHVQL